MSRIDKAVNIEDLRKLAIRRLPRFVGDYIETGAGDGGGVRRNISAFRQYQLVPRGLVDVRGLDTSTELFGRKYASCFGISAVGTSGLYRRHADVMLAEAAREANLPFILSGGSSSSVEDVIRAAPDHTWYQLYGSRQMSITDRMIGRAMDAGIKVLVFTVDYPAPVRSEVVARTGISLGSGPTWRTFPRAAVDALRHPEWAAEYVRWGGMPKLESWAEFAPSGSNARELARFHHENWHSNQTWTDVERVRKQWPGAMIIKGLVEPGDVLRAVDAGVDAVTISNHGGNKLDCMQGCLDALATIRPLIAPNIKLLFDGGIRRGSDIVIAKALGAAYCFLGRATLYGVAAGGLAGARRALAIMQSELAFTMAMIGCPTPIDITSDFLAAPGKGRD